MVRTPERIHRIVALADQVESDIRQRGLSPGDRYLGTADAAKLLRVDTAVANRALQLLVKRNVLQRAQRTGTFISQGWGKSMANTLHRVHLILGDPFPQTEGWLDTNMVFAMQKELPGIRIQFHGIEAKDEEAQVDEIVHDALKSPQTEAFVLLRSSLHIQRLFQDSGLFTVLFGHPYASITRLPFADRDQRQIGELMAQYIVSRSHHRAVMLMRQRLLPGDHELIAGARGVFDRAGLPALAVSLLCLPHDTEEVRHALMKELGAAGGPPGVLTRPPLMAEAAVELAASRGLAPHRDMAIVSSDYFDKAQPRYAVIRPVHESDQQGTRLGRLIAQVAQGKLPDGGKQLSPVRLEIPEQPQTAEGWKP